MMPDYDFRHTVQEVILVEGRYDKARLSSFLDAVIFTSEGFGIFHDRERLDLLRQLAEERGLIILTDSDGGGEVIRGYLKGTLPADKIKNAYIPEIYGKERRKKKPGREGKLGVEGMEPEILLQALRRAGATIDGEGGSPKGNLSAADLYALGLSGRPDSASQRAQLLRSLNLPSGLKGNALLEVLNCLFDADELIDFLSKGKSSPCELKK